MRNLYILFMIFTIPYLSGCYKKDLEDFKSIKGTKSTPDIVLPLFYTTLTIKDSIPYQVPTIKLADTVKVDLTNTSSLEGKYPNEISSVELKLITEKNFPIEGSFQIYFVDDTNTILDSLFSTSISAITTNDSINQKIATTIITIDKEKFQELERSTKLFLHYSFSSYSASITEQNYLTVKAGIKVSFTNNLLKL